MTSIIKQAIAPYAESIKAKKMTVTEAVKKAYWELPDTTPWSILAEYYNFLYRAMGMSILGSALIIQARAKKDYTNKHAVNIVWRRLRFLKAEGYRMNEAVSVLEERLQSQSRAFIAPPSPLSIEVKAIEYVNADERRTPDMNRKARYMAMVNAQQTKNAAVVNSVNIGIEYGETVKNEPYVPGYALMLNEAIALTLATSTPKQLYRVYELVSAYSKADGNVNLRQEYPAAFQAVRRIATPLNLTPSDFCEAVLRYGKVA